MTYRDPNEALFAKTQSLESQLADAQREIERLRAESEATAAERDLVDLPPPVEGSQDWQRPSMRPGFVLALALASVGVVGLAGVRAARIRSMEFARYHHRGAYGYAPYSVKSPRANALHANHFLDAVSWTGRVVASVGSEPVAVGTACAVRASPVSSPEFNCRFQIDCGGFIYGATNAGFTQCQIESGIPVRAYDGLTSRLDGDARMTLDLTSRRIVVSDDRGGNVSEVTVALDPTEP